MIFFTVKKEEVINHHRRKFPQKKNPSRPDMRTS